MGGCFSVSSAWSNSSTTTAKVITSNGQLLEYPTSYCVSQVLAFDQEEEVKKKKKKKKKIVLCNSDSLCYDDYIPAMAWDAYLEPNQMYFILPATMLHNPLSASDMASLAVKATQALVLQDSNNNNKNKLQRRRISPHNDSDNDISAATTTIKTFSNIYSRPRPKPRPSSSKLSSRSYYSLSSSRRAKSAVRSFRLSLNTIYEGVD